MYARDIAALLDGKTKLKGNAIVGFCPVCQPDGKGKHGGAGHLHLEDKNDGWAHLSCLMRCDDGAIMAALGLESSDRCHTAKTPEKARAKVESARATTTIVDTANLEWKPLKDIEGKIQKRYPYQDLERNARFYKFRFSPTITKREDGTEKVKKNLLLGVIEGDRVCLSIKHLNGKSELLYRWPEVNAAIAAGQTIYINEGEKACDRMAESGLCGTCQPFGTSGGWADGFTAMLKGAKEVVIVADRDEVGETYARAVCAKLKAARISARVVQSATTGDKDDAYDHLEAGNDVSSMVPRPDLMPVSKIEWAISVEARDVDWLAYPYFPRGMVCGIEGEPGIGKGMISSAIATAISLGAQLPWMEEPFPMSTTLMIALEDSKSHTIKPRLDRFGADCSKVALYTEPFTFDFAGLDLLEELIQDALDPALVIIDPFTSYTDPATATKKITMREIMSRLKLISEKYHTCVLCVRHLRKNPKESSDIDAGYGGIEIIGGWRSALAVRPNPDDPREKIARHIKNNVGPLGDPFSYELRKVDDTRDFDLVWIPQSKPTQRNRIKKHDEPVIETAKRFLMESLAGGMVLSEDLFSEWKSRGFGRDALYQAKKIVGAVDKKQGFADGRVRWWLPDTADLPYDPYTDS